MSALADNRLCACGCGTSAPLAPFNDRSRGWVKGKPLQFVHGHGRRKPLRYERDEASGCWNWSGATTSAGYGAFRRNGQHHLAHRYFYEQAKGPIPAGLQLDHLCHNRKCVNPDHLEPVTVAENIRRGEGTKLTPSSVRAIRQSTETQARLATRFGVTRGAIDGIRRGKNWRGVGGE